MHSIVSRAPHFSNRVQAMTPKPFHITTIGSGSLFAMRMPDANDLTNNLRNLHNSGIDKVLCLIEPDEADQLGLSAEEELTKDSGMAFERYAIADFGVPDYPGFNPLIVSILNDIRQGKNVLVHCRGGIGRTGLVCCCVLIANGMDATSSIQTVSKKRGTRVPETDAQLAMIQRYWQDC